MSRNWTDNQKRAIEARGMQVLVSAAAGSGKTAVLTERVKRILSDTDDKCNVSDILVVTFTRAAAGEMRDRIYKALKKVDFSDKEKNDHIRRQMVLLPTADICTIDSFCAKIVRENFHLAGVGADFIMLDEKDDAQLKKEAVEKVIASLYEENSIAFQDLNKMFLSERDDSMLEEIITTLYDNSRAHSSPWLWLDTILEDFSPEKKPSETSYAKAIFKFLELFIDYHYPRLEKSVEIINSDPDFHPDYVTNFTGSLSKLTVLRHCVQNRDWDGIANAISNGLYYYVKIARINGNVANKELTKTVYDAYKDDAIKLMERTLPTEIEHEKDCKTLYPIVEVLCSAVKSLSNELEKMKKEINAYAFDDILHKCINLLVVQNKDGWEKTDLAKELTEKYKEILIDEYQDTNEAQNMIFEAISRDKNNLYFVGDVKQSIYSFRLASPELFMNLKNTLSDYDGTRKPSQIILEKNFRSRNGVTSAINYIFSRIMSENVGEIDYDEKEFLYPEAKYFKKSGADTDILFVGENTDSGENVTEQKAICDYIRRVVNSGVEVVDPETDEVRPVKWKDFCILLRSAKKKTAKYSEELKKVGIPVNAFAEGESVEYKEIKFLISLIKAINNPLMDIELISVMSSPVFGFTVDELSEVRMVNRNCDFYTCLLRCSENSVKITKFLEKLQLYRNVAAAHPIDEFVRFVVSDTAVGDIYYAVGNGEKRQSNVNGFKKLADDFVASGRGGLSDFVRYIDNAVDNEALKSLGSVTNENSVKIMSIHKSKGLEFPYVILADCSKPFNRGDSYDALTVSKETGIGLKIRDDERMTKYHTISSFATEKAILFSGMSEELRVLYVALTRAREHLTLVCDVSSKSLKTKIKANNEFSVDLNGKFHPYGVFNASHYTEWLLTAFASHRDCGVIRSISGISMDDFDDDTSFNIDTVVADCCDSFTEENSTIVTEIDEEFLTTVKKNISYSYPYDFSGILAKRTASSLESNAKGEDYFASSKPGFLSDKVVGSDRGTAVHRFLELCDFRNANDNLQQEKNRILNAGYMSEKELEVVDGQKLSAFFDSSVGKRLLNSQHIFKEYEFSVLKKAKDLYNDLPQEALDEEIVVQGKLDCAFVENGKIILIDYKTDKSTKEEYYINTYSPQLRIYSEAIEECTGLNVAEVYVYSFSLDKFIEIN